ncbi:MAG: IclR family transcriptional regulator [Kiloniellales bacterium]|nr:IclR family transcriptional regulator [Kiloniellales bacterium]
MPAKTRRNDRKDARPRYSAPALEKGLDIIELLSDARQPLSMAQVAQRLERSRSEIFRMLTVLEARGYIARGETSDHFSITNKLFDLGMRKPPIRGLLEIALPEMRILAREIGQSCHLAVASGDHNVVIARAENPGEESFAVSLGYRRHLADSTSGRVLLAFQDETQRERLLAAARRTAPAGYDEGALTRALNRIRNRGYERAVSRSLVGITDIGAPIIGAQDAAVAALTVPFVKRVAVAHDMEAAIDAVRAAAARISAVIAIA